MFIGGGLLFTPFIWLLLFEQAKTNTQQRRAVRAIMLPFLEIDRPFVAPTSSKLTRSAK
jgi:hypothetical protein